ncbi:response regulator transcription factor [Sphingobium sp. YR768]|uniref:response regulator transcription factor n=1 Tax=Sphingobium sp. YR768 TaxID=1884365 RepID=UPI0008D7F685|nr:response regulator transcription factor [Sphingobium sp. YR768]SEQ69947.1 two component transcriptional regulator, LuxR family [Sphingobium sp. YR768]
MSEPVPCDATMALAGLAMRRRILLADDHPLFREALKTALHRILPETRVEETDSIAGVRAALSSDVTVELLLLDLKLPDSEGFAGLMLLRVEYPQVPIVIVSATEDASAISDALAMGAQGFISKSASLQEMADALTAILDGEVWSPRGINLRHPSHSVQVLASLTPAQRRVLSHLKSGLMNKQIANEMGVSQATVKAHLAALFRRLGASNRTQALARAFAMDGDPAKASAAPPDACG